MIICSFLRAQSYKKNSDVFDSISTVSILPQRREDGAKFLFFSCMFHQRLQSVQCLLDGDSLRQSFLAFIYTDQPM